MASGRSAERLSAVPPALATLLALLTGTGSKASLARVPVVFVPGVDAELDGVDAVIVLGKLGLAFKVDGVPLIVDALEFVFPFLE